MHGVPSPLARGPSLGHVDDMFPSVRSFSEVSVTGARGPRSRSP
jgi:hypothetical protein